METIKSKLGKGTLFVTILDTMSIVFSIFNYNIRLFSWIDNWGNTMSWIIRVLIIVEGGTLFFLFGNELNTNLHTD